MIQPPPLTDREALARHRARSRQLPGHDDAMFLHRLALADIQERLIEVNRTFTAPAIITAFPEIWQDLCREPVMVPDAEDLALEVGTHDLVVHAMGLHWSNDPVGQLAQCRRALRPDGLLIAVLPGGRTLHELRSCLAEAEARVTEGLSPRVVPMGEIRDLGAVMQRAGLALPVADSLVQTVEYRSFATLLSDLRAAGETNALASRLRRFTGRRVLAEAASLYSESFASPEGRLRATVELVFLTGWAPHESQQQPLRPGSAKQRLADALGVPEAPLPKGS
ncbi:MAG: methyltransferase domain-containing protein [Tabrizicola sp.]|nr:methyltransferase domain-containing protein [Tabrizicola sp.]